MKDTIIALASGAGRAGVAIIRISGPNSTQILELITERSVPKPRYASMRSLYDNAGQVIDKALVLYFNAPNSFTGEDIIELHIHGGRAILSSVLSICLNTKLCRFALAGEFSRQAFYNGKMDLTEAEGLADFIEAETEAQRKQALKQMEGELGKLARIWREDLIDCMAQAEAYIDFPDEDLPTGLDDSARRRILVLKDSLQNHLHNSSKAQKVRDGFKIVLIGAPNAGKSTLLNALAKREVAIVSSLAGTTRDIVEISFTLNGNLIWIADTAGLRETNDEIEKEGVRRALERSQTSDLRLGLASVLDEAKEVLKHLEPEDILIWTKSDQITHIEAPDCNVSKQIFISAKSGDGIDILENIISERAAISIELMESAPLTRERHKEAVSNAIFYLDRALVDETAPPELVCEDLRMAARELASITGEVGLEDVLDRVFSSFCIGK